MSGTRIQETSDFERQTQRERERQKHEERKCVSIIAQEVIRAIESSERRSGFITVRMRLHSMVFCSEVKEDINATLREHNVKVTKLESVVMNGDCESYAGCCCFCCPCVALPIYMCYTAFFGDHYTFDVRIDVLC